jgi:fructoselysine 6-kinase
MFLESRGKKMRVVTVGDNCIDDYEELGISYPTGNSVDVAIHLSRLGVPVSIVSVTGNDQNGEQMINLLKKHEINLSYFHRKPGNTAITKMELNGNDRVHVKYFEGVLKDFMLFEDDVEFITGHDLVHTSFWGKVNDQLPILKKMGVQIVYDFSIKLVNGEIKSILPNVDYAFFSYYQRDSYIKEYMKWAKELGPEVVIVMLGEEGSIAYDGERFYEEGIVSVPVVNTVGAGDSFIAGYIYGVVNAKPIQECLQLGAKVAADVIQVFEPY